MALEAGEGSHCGTIESVKRELSIFDRRPYQVTHLKTDWIKHVATNNSLGYEENTPITFSIARAPGLYIDLNDSYCVFEVELCGESGSKLASGEIAFVNNSMHSLFSDVSMSINGTKVEGEDAHYAYKSYLYCLLDSTKESKKYQMHVQGWMMDEQAKHDLADNPAFLARAKWTKDGKSTVFSGPLFLDLWLQEQYITDACELDFKFTRSTPKFCLQCHDADPKPKIRFKRAELWLRKVSPSPSVIDGHIAGLVKQNAVWPYNAHSVMVSHHPQSIPDIHINDCTKGIYPKCIVAGMVTNEAYNGTI